MARSLNKVQLIGNLGADPELRHTASGVPVVSFSLATNWSRTNESGTTEENTEWHNIVAWRRLAEICQQYLSKGSKVYLEGRIQTRSWDDTKNPGQKRYMTEIVVNQMIMLDPPGASRGGPPRSAEAPQGERSDSEEFGGYPDSDDFDDDLPF